jgi:hypothetical protein
LEERPERRRNVALFVFGGEMLFLKNSPKNTAPLLLALVGLLSIFAFMPEGQTDGVQGNVFTGATITTTAQTAIVACGQGAGAVGRKTLVVENSAVSTGTITVTAELRTDSAARNFTSGYLAVNAVATNTASSDTALPSEAAGKYCYVSAVSSGGSVVTVTLRRE